MTMTTQNFFKLLRHKLAKNKLGKHLLIKATDLYFEINELPMDIIIKELSFMPIGKKFYWYSEKLKQIRDDYMKKHSINLSPQLTDIIKRLIKEKSV